MRVGRLRAEQWEGKSRKKESRERVEGETNGRAFQQYDLQNSNTELI